MPCHTCSDGWKHKLLWEQKTSSRREAGRQRDESEKRFSMEWTPELSSVLKSVLFLEKKSLLFKLLKSLLLVFVS